MRQLLLELGELIIGVVVMVKFIIIIIVAVQTFFLSFLVAKFIVLVLMGASTSMKVIYSLDTFFTFFQHAILLIEGIHVIHLFPILTLQRVQGILLQMFILYVKSGFRNRRGFRPAQGAR